MFLTINGHPGVREDALGWGCFVFFLDSPHLNKTQYRVYETCQNFAKCNKRIDEQHTQQGIFDIACNCNATCQSIEIFLSYATKDPAQ